MTDLPRPIRFALILLVALLLSSCSVLDEWYINNETDETIAISIVPDSPREGAPDIKTAPLISTFEPGVIQQLSQLTEYSEDEGRVSFTLAPHSTAYIGGAIGGLTPFRSLDVTLAAEQINLNRQNAGERFVIVNEEPAWKIWLWTIRAR